MTILSILYSRHAAAAERLNALTSAYSDMPEARQSMAKNPKALAFINAASEFQATLRNTVSHAGSALVREFGAHALPVTAGKPGDPSAQLAIASGEPNVNQRLNVLLAAHKNYVAENNFSFNPRRLWRLTMMDR